MAIGQLDFGKGETRFEPKGESAVVICLSEVMNG